MPFLLNNGRKTKKKKICFLINTNYLAKSIPSITFLNFIPYFKVRGRVSGALVLNISFNLSSLCILSKSLIKQNCVNVLIHYITH